jgi:hypothetical protein
MHDDRNAFRAPAREPKPGTFHRPAHGFGIKPAPEGAKLKVSGPMTGEQKLGEGLAELPLGGAHPSAKEASPLTTGSGSRTRKRRAVKREGRR